MDKYKPKTTKKKFIWSPNPKTGWWKDQDVLRLYHGTHIRNVDSIAKDGMTKFDPNTRMISMALEPNTAYGYSAMSGAGGELEFRKAGGRAVNTPREERAVVIFDVPMEWIMKHYDPSLSGNTPPEKKRMSDVDTYREGMDFHHYAKCELRFKTEIPAKYMVGWTQKL